MPPLGKIRVNYAVRENPRGVLEVLVGENVVCHLPASAVTWKLTPGDVGMVTIDIIAERANVESIDGEASR